MIIFNKQYYDRIVRQYNYNNLTIGEIDFDLGLLSQSELKSHWICHSQANVISQMKSEGKRVIVSTGVGLSGIPHVGTLTQIFNALEMQKAGLSVQMVLGDLDAYNGKDIPLKKVIVLTKKYREFIQKLGFLTGNGSRIRDQFNELAVLRTMYLSGKYMDDGDFDKAEEDLHDFYVKRGLVDASMTFRRKLSLALMSSDFIDLIYSDGYEGVLVMLGIDEHKYVLFSQNILLKMIKQNLIKQGCMGAIYSPLIKGFYNYPKMSKSIPQSTINVLTKKDDIVDKLLNGEGNYQDPNENVVFQMMTQVGGYTSENLEKRYKSCEKNNSEWSDYKIEYADKLDRIFKLWE